MSLLTDMLHMIREGKAHMINPADIDKLDTDAKDVADVAEDVEKVTDKTEGGPTNAS